VARPRPSQARTGHPNLRWATRPPALCALHEHPRVPPNQSVASLLPSVVTEYGHQAKRRYFLPLSHRRLRLYAKFSAYTLWRMLEKINMSITPAGGWNKPNPPEVQPLHSYARTPNTTTVVLHQEKQGSSFGRAFFGCLGVVCAVFFIIFALGILGKIASDSPSPSSVLSAPTTSSRPKEAVRVAAPILNAAYQANEVAADEKYGDKILHVYGQTKSIEKDGWSNIHVRIYDSALFTYGSLLGVDATMRSDPANEETAAGLHIGQRVAVSCTSVRYIVGTVMLENCTFEADSTPPPTPTPNTPDDSAPYAY